MTIDPNPPSQTRTANLPEKPEPSRQVRRQEERRISKLLAAADRIEGHREARGKLLSRPKRGGGAQ